jgi:hypothetical protein
MSITKEDLYTKQFNLETLKANIYAVSLTDILKTQKLTADFCIKYILNSDFQFTDEDQVITIELVRKFQPHISNIDFILAQESAEKKRVKKERIDSFEDFETYANKHS